MDEIVDDTQLEKLTIKELQVLKEQIDQAVRAVIRASRSAKIPGFALADLSKPDVARTDPPKMDLERERDAWLSAKR